jgi:formate/nitrite transporter FocA (FNT family)
MHVPAAQRGGYTGRMTRDPGTDEQRPDGRADGVVPDVAPTDEEQTFDRTVDEGRQRLGRSWLQLIATGLLGGLDIGVGVLAFLLVKHLTGDPLLSGLAFATGFIALTLAKSELFTENFLVPVAAVVAKEAKPPALVRLWVATLVTNLIAGWFVAALLMLAFPDLRSTAIEAAASYVGLSTSWHAFALAVVGGMLVTLMTHLQHTTESDGLRLVPAVMMGFILSVGPRQPRGGVDHLLLRGADRGQRLRVRGCGAVALARGAGQCGRRPGSGHAAEVDAGAPQGGRRP